MIPGVVFTEVPGAYSSEASHYRCFTLGYAPGLTHKHYNRLVKLAKDKLTSLFKKIHKLRTKVFYNIDTWGQCYKSFYVRNLQMFAIGYSVCHKQAFLVLPNVCEKGWSLLNRST
jgi:hypothetical protein